MDPDRVDTEKIKVAWISSKDNLPCQIITICDVTEQKSMLSATLLKPLQLFFFFFKWFTYELDILFVEHTGRETWNATHLSFIEENT